MNTSFLQIVRTIVVILVCGIGVASTSREMHSEPVEPYYVQLANGAEKLVIDHTKEALALGETYVRGLAK